MRVALGLVIALLAAPVAQAHVSVDSACHSRACVKRVAKQRAIHRRYEFCHTWRCVVRSDVHRLGFSMCNAWRCVRHVRLARYRRQVKRWRAYAAPLMGVLNRIAACESHGNPRAVSSTGKFRGKFQFDYGTWAGVGGSGDPAAASEAEQDFRAARLYRLRGGAPWPVCRYH